MKTNPLQDAESQRQQRNMTNAQRKANNFTKEGVIVNSFYKDTTQSVDLHETYDTLIISNNAKMPKKLTEHEASSSKNLLPISGVVMGVMGVMTLLSGLVRHSAKVNSDIIKGQLSELKRMPSITRNVALNEETHQALYQMIQSPNAKTIMAGVGVLTLTAMAFMGKTFFDGFKDVWVKRREADIEKNLQENLIDVETQSFSGKMQIIRSMLAKHAIEFDKYLTDDKDGILLNFGRKKLNPLTFTGKNKNEQNKTNSLSYILLGIGTALSIAGLGFAAMKNLTKGKFHLEEYVKDSKTLINEVIKNSNKDSVTADKIILKNKFRSIGAKTDAEIKEYTSRLKWNKSDIEEFTKEVIEDVQVSTVKVNEAMGGSGAPKVSFYSHVDDYRAFFYNWLLDTENPQFKQLFFGITGLTAISYGGKLAGDAIKDVQVKKINAETELELQKRLVSTELRNFKSKKDAAVQPLVEEFYRQVDAGKSKTELKTMAENILYEIKNGAPFVYS